MAQCIMVLLFDNNTILDSVITGVASSENRSAGLAPIPTAGNNGKFLIGDGTWSNIVTNTSISSGIVTSGSGQANKFRRQITIAI